MQIRDLIPWGRDRDGKEVEAPESGETGALTQLQRDMNRVFDDFWGKVGHAWSGRPGPAGVFGPSTDIAEADDHVVVEIELPGMSDKDIDITMSEGALSIRGEKRVERENKSKGVYMSERSYGAFYRTIPLPPGLDTDKAEATFRNGVLEIRLPKTREALANVKRIPVKAA